MSLVMPTLVSEHSDPEMYVFEPRNPTEIVSDAPGNIFNTVLYPMGQTIPIFHIGGGPSFVSLMDVSDPPNPLPVALIELSGTRWGGRRDASIIAEFIEWDMQLSSPSVDLYQFERDVTNPGDVSDRETLIHYSTWWARELEHRNSPICHPRIASSRRHVAEGTTK
ncbi:hypothetical protein CC1G_10872 [Coprinopsis cinerea okayama7|uniref:Uncharacterized protein n=1 Tax=Coprinopsis cinerea (strain Okayama-7 / 130 / ATCC MYA-4618 / FGSC 9003) TaxID=240176 RepID=A8NKV5_COPC7|nr:hypothetical protein CC1G_10872 [Coprinopsis cinerea okayama7\|eukprot:XP_001834554.1 hypothetical protein CC1G_10872 [Coprinopsis cinerea okayama7\